MFLRKTMAVFGLMVVVSAVGINKISSEPVTSSIGELLAEMKPQRIVLIDGGIEKEVFSTAETVGLLLKEQKILVGADDIVIPAAYQKLTGVQQISIIRVTRSVYDEVVEIPAVERRVPDEELFVGEKKELVEGINGSETRQVELISADAKPVAKRVIKVTDLVQPQDKVVVFGTRDTIEIDGEKVKIMQAMEVEATAYTAGFQCTGKTPDHPYYGITASGLPVKIGHIAVDPKVIAMHSKVYVVGIDDIGREYTGYYTATDTGGAIKGHKIDIYMEEYDEVYRFGRRKMKLYVLDIQ